MKNVLVISWHFAPQNAVGAIRMTKMVKYLARTGEYHFWIICKEMDEKEARDSILQRDMDEVSKYVTICPVHMYKKDFIEKLKIHVLRRCVKQKGNSNVHSISYSDVDRNLISNTENGIIGKIKRIIGKVLIFANDIYIFISNDMAFAKSGYKIYKQMPINSFDAMITTWAPTGNLLLGLKIKKINKKTKWIVDYRDACRTSFVLKQIGLNSIACKADRAADYITGVNKKCNGSGRYLGKFHMICNSYDKEDTSGLNDYPHDEKLTMVYTGSVYKIWNLESLFKIIHELIKENLIDSRLISFKYAGNDFREVEYQARKYKVDNILNNMGRLSRNKALELQHQADILCVVACNNDKEGNEMPSKFLEYFMMKKPIFSIVVGNRKGSIVKQITDRTRIGYSYEESSGVGGYLDAKQWVLAKYKEFLEKGNVGFDPDYSYLERFSSFNMAMRFKRLIDK